MITITHNHETGTLIEGTAKGDGTAEVLKRSGWRWGRSISTWYVPNSRDRHAKMHTINHTAAQLEASGFEISIDIDDTARTTAEVEAAKIQRQQDRVAALQAKAERRSAAADSAHQDFRRRLDQLPPMGEPVKIGHHSEGRHRAAIKRADTAFNRVHAAHEAATHAETAAASAAITTASRYNPRTVANRIEKIAAEIRSYQRDLDGYIAHRGSPYAEQIAPVSGTTRDRVTSRLAEKSDELQYWQTIREQQIAEGTATNYTPDQITKGDAVKIRGEWRRVARVNPKSVSVETPYSWTDKAPYTDIQDHKKA